MSIKDVYAWFLMGWLSEDEAFRLSCLAVSNSCYTIGFETY